VASLPPLTDRQRDILALLLSKRRQPGEATARELLAQNRCLPFRV
jgi:hypothetical protein